MNERDEMKDNPKGNPALQAEDYSDMAIEPEMVPPRETALALRSLDLAPQMVRSPEEALAQLREFQRFVGLVMVEGVDYGFLPGVVGTDGKPKRILYQAGAQMLAEIYGYFGRMIVDEKIERFDDPIPFFSYLVRVEVVSKRTGFVVGYGIGSANSREARYRWRKGARTCPACGAETIIRGKIFKEGDPGTWVCWARDGGGCREKFAIDDPAITDQVVGRIENEDIADQANTLLKMAKKRAYNDAIIAATRSAGMFTTDLEQDNLATGEAATSTPRARGVKASAGDSGQPAPVASNDAGGGGEAPETRQSRVATAPAAAPGASSVVPGVAAADAKPPTREQMEELWGLIKALDLSRKRETDGWYVTLPAEVRIGMDMKPGPVALGSLTRAQIEKLLPILSAHKDTDVPF
jgi:hypothetical protein